MCSYSISVIHVDDQTERSQSENLAWNESILEGCLVTCRHLSVVGSMSEILDMVREVLRVSQ